MQSTQAMFFHEHVFFKSGGSTKATPFHHDQPYYPIDGDQTCTIWMPIYPIDRKESSLKFISGSHLWGTYFTPRKFSSNLEYKSQKEDFRDKNRFMSLPEDPAVLQKMVCSM